MAKSKGVGRGGARPGAGRPRTKPEAPKRAARDIRVVKATVLTVEALARKYTLIAIETLAEIALNGEKEQARVAASNALLDRGHGKATAAPRDSLPTAPGDAWDDLLDAPRH